MDKSLGVSQKLFLLFVNLSAQSLHENEQHLLVSLKSRLLLNLVLWYSMVEIWINSLIPICLILVSNLFLSFLFLIVETTLSFESISCMLQKY